MLDKRRTETHGRDEVLSVIRRVFRENGRDFIREYGLAILCMLVISGTTAGLAILLKPIVDSGFVAANWSALYGYCALLVVIYVMRGIAMYGQTVLLAQIGNNIIARYQKRLFEHLMRLDIGYFTVSRSGQLSAQVAQNVTGIRNLLNMTVTTVGREIPTLISLVGVMVFMDPLLSLAAFIVGPPMIYAINYLTRRVRKLARESVEINSRFLGAMQESIQGIAIVKAFTMENALSDKMLGLIERAENRSNKIARVSERMTPITEILVGLSIASVLAYAGWRASRQGVPPGSVISFIGAMILAYDPVRKLARVQVNLERALVNARMIYEILDAEPRQGDVPGAKPLAVDQGDILFDKVRFSYAEHMPVLQGVSFEAKAGKTTAIVGPSGAGKSTLFSLLQRFYDLEGGTITIDGQDISRVTKRSLRSAIAYVSQHPYLFEGTIRDNIRYGRPDATDAEIKEAAKLANAEEFILQQAEGYDTPVGENGATLSGGQRQRLSIARAIVRDAPILLLDEATSALDNESEAKVQQALERVMKTRTTLVIAHRLSTVINADRIIVLEEGQLVEQGTHRTLIRKPHGVYARFYRMQTQKTDDLLGDTPVDEGRMTKATDEATSEESR